MIRAARSVVSIPLVLPLLLGVAACGTDDSGDDVPDGTVDVRVPVPAASPDYVDLVTPDIVIPSGVEKMYCLHLANDQGELAVDLMDTVQGEYGHHVVLLTTVEPQPPGTLEDCSDQQDMWKYRSFLLPDTELPDGHAIRVPPGLPYVMQIHYVNAGDAPILVRDVARLRRKPPAEVRTWVTTLTTNSLRLALAPGTSRETFDCTLTEDVDLLLLGGHMHETGATFRIEVGPSATQLDTMYLVDPWRPSYRDAPPVTLFFTQPRRVTAGTVVRTSCEWNNPTSGTIEFPAEMCAAFGYIAGTSTPVHCEPAP